MKKYFKTPNNKIDRKTLINLFSKEVLPGLLDNEENFFKLGHLVKTLDRLKRGKYE